MAIYFDLFVVKVFNLIVNDTNERSKLPGNKNIIF